MIIKAHDPCGNIAAFKRVVNNAHTIDILFRMDGQEYHLEGDWLKSVMPHVESRNQEREAEISELRIFK